MDSQPVLRGYMYNTRFVFRCPMFSECLVCKQCDNYNKHNALCFWCESGKNQKLLCNHNDAQQVTIRVINDVFRRPISHPDDRQSGINVERVYKSEMEIDAFEKRLDAAGMRPKDIPIIETS